MTRFLGSLVFARATKRARIAVFMMMCFGVVLFTTAVGQAATPAVMGLSVSSGDADFDGHIDRLVVTFSVPMVTQNVKISSGAGDPGLRADGYTITSAGFPNNNTTLIVNLAEKTAYDTDATPMLHYEAGAPDTESLKVSVTSEELETGDFDATTDKAGPKLLSADAKDIGPTPAIFNTTANGGDQLWLTFSEPVKLTGVDPITRWNSLERAIKINAVTPNLCTDGDNTSQSFNFPQPKPGRPDAIDSPTPNVLHVTLLGTADAFPPNKTFTAVPQGCNLGVDPNVGSSLTDLANNSPINQDQPAAGAGRVWVQPVDIKLLSASTIDKDLNGKIDGVKMTFDQFIEDSTFNDNLDDVSIVSGSVTANVDTSGIGDAGDQDNANDNVVLVNFTMPSGQSWDGGTMPTVAYTKPANCTGSGGTGIKGNVPTPGFKACVASFSQASTDGVGPIILAARTLDVDGNGKLDRIELTFSEALASVHTNGWTVNAQPINSITIDGTNARKATVTFAEGTSGDTGTLPPIAYTTQPLATATTDANGQQIIVPGTIAVTDAAAPRIRTATIFDDDHDGDIEKVELQYSEALATTGAASQFSFGGVAATAIAQPVDNMLALTVSVPDTFAKDLVFTAGTPQVKDAAGNATGDQTVAAAAVVDQAAPVGSIAIAEGAPMNVGNKTVTITYTEAMATDAVTAQYTAGAINRAVDAVPNDANHNNGWRIDDPKKWDGTFSVEQGDCAVSTGCAASVTASGAKDLKGLTQVASTLETSIDTVAPDAPVIGTFAATVTAGETVPADTINMFTQSFTVGGSFVAGQATGGKLEILVDGQPLTPAAASPAIAGAGTSATAVTAFANAAALQDAIDEGARALSVRLCDASNNCSAGSATTVSVNADYTGVGLTLTAPQGITEADAGSPMTISWDGDDLAAGFDNVDVAYSTNGTTFPNAILSDSTNRDGTHGWTVPWLNGAVTIRVTTTDSNGNKVHATSGAIDVVTPQTFTDVPRTHAMHIPIEKIYAAGITTGCTSTTYCPSAGVTRAQMATFLVRAMGIDDNLPEYSGRFSDVPLGAPHANAIEYLFQNGITIGCAAGRYCPTSPVTRGQMAVFILRSTGQTNLEAYQGIFSDVPASAGYARWVESLYTKGITGGCAANPLRYCPGASVTRAQMATFIMRAWNL